MDDLKIFYYSKKRKIWYRGSIVSKFKTLIDKNGNMEDMNYCEFTHILNQKKFSLGKIEFQKLKTPISISLFDEEIINTTHFNQKIAINLIINKLNYPT